MLKYHTINSLQVKIVEVKIHLFSATSDGNQWEKSAVSYLKEQCPVYVTGKTQIRLKRENKLPFLSEIDPRSFNPQTELK